MKRTAFALCVGFLLTTQPARAGDPSEDAAPWNYTTRDGGCCDKPARARCFTPTMFGDQFQFGGFNFNQGGFNFNQGGFNFNQGGGNFNQGGFNQGGGNFNQGGFNFNQGGGFNFQFGGPIAVARGAFKVAENESPRPQDRIFGTYNYYNNVDKTQDVHRETVGFETTLFGDDFSVGMRLPFFQPSGPGFFNQSGVSDLNIVLKYAAINDPDTVLSTGLVVTTPTGDQPFVLIPQGNRLAEVHSVLLQPFVGYLWRREDFFVHGFSSVMVPTDSRDVTVMYNDVGIGYWLYRGAGALSAVVPTFEVHVNTPLNHRDAEGMVKFNDSVNLTAGSSFLFGDRTSLGVAVGTPVTGPRLFAVEALVNFNIGF